MSSRSTTQIVKGTLDKLAIDAGHLSLNDYATVLDDLIEELDTLRACAKDDAKRKDPK